MSRTRVEGLAEVRRALGALGKAAGNAALARVAKRRLEPMRDTAIDLAPEDEGDLKASIIISTRQGKTGRKFRGDKASTEVYMGPNERGYPQAMPQEFGSPNNPPAGYMRGAWDEHKDALLEGIGEDLATELITAAERAARRRRRRQGG